MGRYYTIKGGARGVPVQPITIDDILRYREDPTKMLTTSPFGLTEEEYEKGVRYIYPKRLKRMGWKGLHGPKFWEYAENHVNKKGEKGGLARGLRNAIEISKKAAGTKGVGIGPGGVIMPLKAIKQMELAGKL